MRAVKAFDVRRAQVLLRRSYSVGEVAWSLETTVRTLQRTFLQWPESVGPAPTAEHHQPLQRTIRQMVHGRRALRTECLQPLQHQHRAVVGIGAWNRVVADAEVVPCRGLCPVRRLATDCRRKSGCNRRLWTCS